MTTYADELGARDRTLTKIGQRQAFGIGHVRVERAFRGELEDVGLQRSVARIAGAHALQDPATMRGEPREHLIFVLDQELLVARDGPELNEQSHGHVASWARVGG